MIKGTRRWAVLMLAGLLAAAAGQLIRPAEPVAAYNLMCCPFKKQAGSTKLRAAIWPQHYFDTSGWFEVAVAAGFAAWNNAQQGVVVQEQFIEDSTADILFWTDTNVSDNSTGGCYASRSDGTCIYSIMQLVEGCTSNSCAMIKETPNYDQYTVAHEEGHALGLDHSCVNNALMSGTPRTTTCSGGNPPYVCHSGESSCIDTPQTDDINGMAAMYGWAPPHPPCYGILCYVNWPYAAPNPLAPVQQILRGGVPSVSPPGVPSPGVSLP